MKKYLIHIAVFLLMLTPASHAAYIDTDAEVAVVIDGHTGKVLFSKDKDKKTYPASMTKIMTTLIIFEKLANETLSLDDKFLVSEKAWREREGSSMFVEVDKEIRVEDLLRGIIVQSGNDACIVVAENIAGTEESFAKMMTQKAKEIGMKNTNFTNSTGWPDPDLTTTAHDLALLSAALIKNFPADKFPELYPIFKKKTYTLNGIKQGNRNPLLYGKSSQSKGVDGLKTGYTSESGYGLVASAERGGQRVIMVLNGMNSKKERSAESRRLLDFIFREYKNYEFFKSGEIIDKAEVWLGDAHHVSLVLENGFSKVLSRAERAKTELRLNWAGPVAAPISKGQQIGELIVSIDSTVTNRLPLLAAEDVSQLGMLDRVGEALKYLIFGAPVITPFEK